MIDLCKSDTEKTKIESLKLIKISIINLKFNQIRELINLGLIASLNQILEAGSTIVLSFILDIIENILLKGKENFGSIGNLLETFCENSNITELLKTPKLNTEFRSKTKRVIDSYLTPNHNQRNEEEKALVTPVRRAEEIKEIRNNGVINIREETKSSNILPIVEELKSNYVRPREETKQSLTFGSFSSYEETKSPSFTTRTYQAPSYSDSNRSLKSYFSSHAGSATRS